MALDPYNSGPDRKIIDGILQFTDIEDTPQNIISDPHPNLPSDERVLLYSKNGILYSLNSSGVQTALGGEGGGGGATELAALTDVSSATPTDKHFLIGNGSTWESRLLTEGDVSDLQDYVLSSDIDAIIDASTHSHTLSDITDSGTAAALNVAVSGDAAAGEVVKGDDSRLTGAQQTSEKGQPSGYASLDGSGKVPAAELPSYVDDVLEYADLGSFPVTGESSKIYVAQDSGRIYRWTGSIYVEVSADAGAPVTSVNTQTGAVVLDTGDLTEVTDKRYVTDADLTTLSDLAGGHTHTLSEITDSGTSAALDVAASGDAAAGEVVKGDDSRLTDSRTPTAHTHTLAQVTDSGTSAALDVAASGDAAAGEVVKGDDTRLVAGGTAIQASDLDSLSKINALALDGDFADATHTHALNDLSDVNTSGAADGKLLSYSGGSWIVADQETKEIGLAVSDETTPLTVSSPNALGTFRMPLAMSLLSVKASVTTAPLNADIIVDIKVGGTTIFNGNLLTIDAGSKTSVGSVAPWGLSVTSLADDAEIEIITTQVGVNPDEGAGLKVWLIGTKV